jgi:hypothetical protein
LVLKNDAHSRFAGVALAALFPGSYAMIFIIRSKNNPRAAYLPTKKRGIDRQLTAGKKRPPRQAAGGAS